MDVYECGTGIELSEKGETKCSDYRLLEYYVIYTFY
jgi:hypothetical protein